MNCRIIGYNLHRSFKLVFKKYEIRIFVTGKGQSLLIAYYSWENSRHWPCNNKYWYSLLTWETERLFSLTVKIATCTTAIEVRICPRRTTYKLITVDYWPVYTVSRKYRWNRNEQSTSFDLNNFLIENEFGGTLPRCAHLSASPRIHRKWISGGIRCVPMMPTRLFRRTTNVN